MHWYIIFAKQTGISSSFVPSNWGLLLAARASWAACSPA